MSKLVSKKEQAMLKALKLKLIDKSVKNPYWGTAGAHGGSVNISDRD